MSYIAFPKQDYYSRFDYHNCRILDALASCMHITTPCAGAFKYKNILYVSYNNHITTRQIPLIVRQLNLIHEAISTNSENETLGLYLLLNKDFTKFTLQQMRYEKDEEIKEKLKFFVEEQDRLSLKFAEEFTSDKLCCINNYVVVCC